MANVQTAATLAIVAIVCPPDPVCHSRPSLDYLWGDLFTIEEDFWENSKEGAGGWALSFDLQK